MAAKWGTAGALLLGLLLTGCAALASHPLPVRVALLAPFEGRYRDTGYQALYAAQMALAEDGRSGVELLPVDDGGSAASAVERARALALDPQVRVVILSGPHATTAEVQKAAGPLPLIIAGHWNARPAVPQAVILANPQMDTESTLPADFTLTGAPALVAPVTGSELLALDGFARLRASLSGILVISVGQLPDAAFEQRYRAQNPYAPPPGLAATLAYDATRLALLAAFSPAPLRSLRCACWNGDIHFDAAGYWPDALIRVYFYGRDRRLLPVIY
ncbi:MAG: ABC transporter substrate-binding protein [Anaerolineae bacterium]|nr:ABC transporter substrate-binding protein [Anaerolineae bacterium]